MELFYDYNNSNMENAFGKYEKIDISEKERMWTATSQQVEATKDRLGKGIDEGVKQVLVAIKVNDFGTTGSCEGHLDRALPYPWIDIESSLAESNLSNPRFQELKEKVRSEHKGGDKISKEEKEEYDSMVKAVMEANLAEHKRLTELLDEFYKSSDEKTPRLIAKKGPWNQSRLQPIDVPKGGTREIQEALAQLTAEQKKRNLTLYRNEINGFAEFLKDRFFNHPQ